MDGAVVTAVTVMVIGFEVLPAELVAATVKAETLAAVGVPLMIPVDEPKLSPAGGVPLVTLHVMGAVPVADRVCE